jgi:flagellar basal body-associated protein FliL
MSTLERQIPDDDNSRRKVIIIVAVVAAIIIAIFFYFLMRASSSIRVEPALAGAIRTGSPEFAQYQPKIAVDEPEATEAKRALGDIVMNIRTNVRNFTGRTLKGLEVKGMVVDHQGQPVNQKTVVVVPTNQPELENNRTIAVGIMLEGMTDQDDRANIKVEVTGFIFK